jgi:hypothetical protein
MPPVLLLRGFLLLVSEAYRPIKVVQVFHKDCFRILASECVESELKPCAEEYVGCRISLEDAPFGGNVDDV